MTRTSAPRQRDTTSTFDEEYERAYSILPGDTVAAAKAFRLMRRRALRLGHRQGAWLALEGLRNVSRFVANARWNLRLCRMLVEECRDAWTLMTLATIELETGRYDSAEAHMVEAIRRAKAKRTIDLSSWRLMLENIRAAQRAHGPSR